MPATLSVKLKDYVIVEYGDKRKKLLAQIIGEAKGDKFEVVFDGASRADAETTEGDTVSRADILANLGPAPKPGTAYGVKVEPYVKTIRHAPWGDIHFFDRLDEQHEEAMLAAMDRVYKELKSMGLHTEFPLETHIRPAKGKYAGSYRFRPGKPTDILSLHPQEWGNRRAVELLLWHELGHYLQTRFFTRKQERRWINAYHDNVTLSSTTFEDLEELRKDFIDSGDVIKHFGSELDEEQGVIWDAIIYWIGTYHALKPKHLDVLVDGGSNLANIWPTDPVFLTNQEVLVTDYANKDPDEFWCEAFCYHMTGGTLPDGEPLPDWIVTLVEDTLDDLTDKKHANVVKLPARLSKQTPKDDDPGFQQALADAVGARGPRRRAA